MSRVLPALLFMLAFPIGVSAQQPATVRDLLSVYRDLNDMCRDPTADELHKMRACNIREKVARLLNSMGYCYGKKGQDATDMIWHKCTEHEIF